MKLNIGDCIKLTYTSYYVILKISKIGRIRDNGKKELWGKVIRINSDRSYQIKRSPTYKFFAYSKCDKLSQDEYIMEML